MQLFKNIFSELSGCRSLNEALEKGISPVSVTGLSHVHRANMLYALDSGKINLVVTASEAEAKKLCDDINTMAGEERAVLFPSKELLFTPVDSANHEYEYMRISALSKALEKKCGIICASIEAVMQPVIPPDVLSSNRISIRQGQEIDLKEFAVKLTENGFQKCEKVDGASQFSVRGSIIDIFPVQSEKPVRIELWGDEVDSINEFETDTQRRTTAMDSVSIPPASELIYDNSKLADSIDGLMKKVRGKRAEKVREILGSDAERLRAGEKLIHSQKYYSLVYDGIYTVFDYIDGFVSFSDYSDILNTSAGISSRYNEDVKILLEEGMLCKGLENHVLELPFIQNRCAST